MKVFVLIIITGLAIVGAVVVFGLLWLILSARRYAREHAARVEAEQTVIETADWIGATGLEEAAERELPRYLRRERGESLFDEGSLKAEDLRYLGSVPDEGGMAHYWCVPGDGKTAFAYIIAWPDGGWNMGWGDREPPQLLTEQALG